MAGVWYNTTEKGGGEMLRIGICDDNREARFALRCALERLLDGRETAFFEFSAGEGLLH